MHTDRRSGLLFLWQRTCKLVIPFCWILGLVLGIISAAGAGDSFFLMMRSADDLAVSIPGLLLVTVLPFLLTAFAVFLSQPWMLIFLVFTKAFSFGFCAFGVMTVYSAASWLVQLFLMFSDGCALHLLMWLWLRHCSLTEKQFPRDLGLCVASMFVLGIIDIYVVSPFAAILL